MMTEFENLMTYLHDMSYIVQNIEYFNKRRMEVSHTTLRFWRAYHTEDEDEYFHLINVDKNRYKFSEALLYTDAFRATRVHSEKSIHADFTSFVAGILRAAKK